ncbi:pSer/pThr/pTyr-binding forkhead associated (FHA) protein [Marmoricola sp. URHA0025 HA25]
MTGQLSSLLGRPVYAVRVLRLPAPHAPFVLVGRSRRCDVVLEDPTVSREHAGLVLFAGHWFVCDRDSTNGTRVNGRRIWGTSSVQPGDLVAFGDTALRLAAPDGS